MALKANAVLTFTGYTITDFGIDLHFTCADPGPGEPNDYRVFVSDTELATVTTLAQFRTLVDAKLNRSVRAANIASKLDQYIGAQRTV